ncbi:kielin/chordin-like protein isoform X2 [Mercenaria mercenaria]|uniref:kielin/chordin-like protein isoform X2 n=1 Tax=Mercenaria mercenaria TaxID=6596 RepID=UPI00234F4344|nr:kielin/chordin-like protein isoform X2 [Mercenaria mercenaria]
MEINKICVIFMICVCGLLALSQVTNAKGECEYNGKTYKNNKSFKEGGKCRKCKCKNGAITCKTSNKCDADFCEAVNCKKLKCENKVTQKDLCCPLCGSEPVACDYNGLTYNDGDTFTSEDGCNTCQCIEGKVACTKMACLGCEKDGQEYNSGTSFLSSDGCNRCMCRNGKIKCTEKTCKDCTTKEGKTVPSGTTFSVDCDMCTCLDGNVKCIDRECPTCSYNGKEYEHKAMFRHEDGCNRCQCLYGQVECTDFDCPDDCMLNNIVIKDGQSFPSADGYNKCWCKDGDIMCTDFNCTLPGNSSCVNNGTVYQSGSSFLNDINEKCVCNDGEFECTDFRCGEAYVVPTLEGPKLCLCIFGSLECQSVFV